MLHEIIEGLNDIVLAQIHHRLCQHPPPEVLDFLKKITEKSSKRFNLAESLPLPQSSGGADHQPVDLENGKFLFPDIKDTDTQSALDLKKKERMIKNLLAKYDRMSSKCKVQVEDVHAYLVQHYNIIHKLAEGKKGAAIQGEHEETSESVPSSEKKEENAHGSAANDMNPNNLNPANLNSAENEHQASGNTGGSPANVGLVPGASLTSNIGNPLLGSNQIINNDMPLKSLRNTDVSLGKTNLNDFGLGKKKGFFSPSEIERYIEDAIKSQNEGPDMAETDEELVKRDTDKNKTKWNVSDKYKKLIETAAKIRLKRKTEEKLGKLYGDKFNRQNSENDIKDYSRIKFESPVVYSLDH